MSGIKGAAMTSAGRDTDEMDRGARRARRLRVALISGFGLTFAFALILQLTADFVAWVTNTKVTFLFPLGLAGAFNDLGHLISVLMGLAMTAVIIAAFLYWRMRSVEESPGVTRRLRELDEEDRR